MQEVMFPTNCQDFETKSLLDQRIVQAKAKIRSGISASRFCSELAQANSVNGAVIVQRNHQK